MAELRKIRRIRITYYAIRITFMDHLPNNLTTPPRRLYMDNAATSFPKPPVVHESAPPNIPARAAGTTPAVALRLDAQATE